MSRFVALIHADEAGWQKLSDGEREQVYSAYRAFSEEAGKAGVVAGGDELMGTDTATTVQVRDGRTVVTDGPFAELKEQIGGYFLLDCDTIDEACAWAAKIPAASHGAIEVRPVYVDGSEAS